MKRLQTPAVKILGILLGGDNPIRIQSMTNTDTADAFATAEQCISLAASGAELVRIAVPDEAAARAVPEIRRILDDRGYCAIPLIGDFHFNGHILLSNVPECAKIFDKYRINPGKPGDFEEFIKIAIEYDKPVRIGVNAGSTDFDIVESAISACEAAERFGLSQDKIVVSVKTADVSETIKAYEKLAWRMRENNHFYCVHAGLTEAGGGVQGLVSSSAALGILLNQGIGDTIRMSLTPLPGEARTSEISACKALLQSFGLRYFRPQVISCPGCGRTDNFFYIELAKKVNEFIDSRASMWGDKTSMLKIAVMGCVVNGPGEAKHSDIAICLPGKNEKKSACVYISGELKTTLTGDNIADEFLEILEEYVKKLEQS